MPLGMKPECIQCKNTETSMWKNTELGYLCNDCNQRNKEEEKLETIAKESSTESLASSQSAEKITLRKSTMLARNYQTRQNPNALPKISVPKGKGRRSIFKKKPLKSATTSATSFTSDYVSSNGQCFQVGDVVAVEGDDSNVYYAQLTAFVTDLYGEKSAVLAWLLPSLSSPPPNEDFDPSTYTIGPAENLPRSLDCMTWVMNLPFDYFRSPTTPYPAVTTPADRYQPGYLWTRLNV